MFILYFIVGLAITVLLHELAHMIVALLCKVKVLVFSIGFGKVLLHKELWGIDFRLSAIPFGGYCRLEGEKGKVKTGWLTKRYSIKMAVVLAGVTANLLIAFLCYWINYKSIKIGLVIDYEFIKAIFTKDFLVFYTLISIVKPNIFILILGIMNLLSALTNIMIFPGLDGGYIWLLLLEKPLKEKFVPFIDKITKIGFIVLNILQVVFVYWIWFV